MEVYKESVKSILPRCPHSGCPGNLIKLKNIYTGQVCWYCTEMTLLFAGASFPTEKTECVLTHHYDCLLGCDNMGTGWWTETDEPATDGFDYRVFFDYVYHPGASTFSVTQQVPEDDVTHCPFCSSLEVFTTFQEKEGTTRREQIPIDCQLQILDFIPTGQRLRFCPHCGTLFPEYCEINGRPERTGCKLSTYLAFLGFITVNDAKTTVNLSNHHGNRTVPLKNRLNIKMEVAAALRLLPVGYQVDMIWHFIRRVLYGTSSRIPPNKFVNGCVDELFQASVAHRNGDISDRKIKEIFHSVIEKKSELKHSLTAGEKEDSLDYSSLSYQPYTSLEEQCFSLACDLYETERARPYPPWWKYPLAGVAWKACLIAGLEEAGEDWDSNNPENRKAARIRGYNAALDEASRQLSDLQHYTMLDILPKEW